MNYFAYEDDDEPPLTEEEKKQNAVNDKLCKMADNYIQTYVQVFCTKNGVQYTSKDLGGTISVYLKIAEKKELQILFMYVSYQKTLKYLSSLYQLAKKIINPSFKIKSKHITNWRYPSKEAAQEETPISKKYHRMIQYELHNLGIACEVSDFEESFQIKILAPKKICPMVARVSYANFEKDLSAFEDFLKVIFEFENIPVNAFIIPTYRRRK